MVLYTVWNILSTGWEHPKSLPPSGPMLHLPWVVSRPSHGARLVVSVFTNPLGAPSAGTYPRRGCRLGVTFDPSTASMLSEHSWFPSEPSPPIHRGGSGVVSQLIQTVGRRLVKTTMHTRSTQMKLIESDRTACQTPPL